MTDKALKMVLGKDSFEILNFDVPKENSKNQNMTSTDQAEPTVVVVFKNADINSAVIYLLQSMRSPANKQKLATVVVQESVYKELLDMLEFNQTKDRYKLPPIVKDKTHEHLSADEVKNGAITFHVFRTLKEAASLVVKETMQFVTASIWVENHAYAYELITRLNCSKYFINCLPKNLDCIEKHVASGTNYSMIHENYHYETIVHNNLQKTIVFPIGCSFAN